MNHKRFITWYFGDGVKEMCAIWKRLMINVPRIFSFGLLLRTILSPWHRDVSLKDWRGLNPMRSLQRIGWNLFSRIIGAAVRVIMILTGVITTVFTGLCMAVFIVIYIFAPAVFIVSVILLFSSYALLAIAALIVIMCIMAYAAFLYRTIGHPPYRIMTIAQLHQQKWFHRVYESIGVDPSSITMDMLQDIASFEKFLHTQQLTKEEFEFVIDREMMRQMEKEQATHFFSLQTLSRIRPIGLRWHFGYTIHLDRYADDLTARDRSNYMQFSFRGFDQEMTLIEVVLARPNENNLIITGEVGSGRHMIIHELARRIRTGYYDHSFLRYMRVLSCDLMSVMAQARNSGEDPDYIVRNLFHEAAYAGNVILVVDNFEQYMEIESRHGFSFSAIIDEYASLPTFRMIGIATEQAFHEHIDSDRVLMRHFDVVPVHEMSETNTMHVLFRRFRDIEDIPYTYQGFREAIVGATRYMNTAPLPTRAINVAMETFLHWQKVGSGRFITAQTVDEFITQKTNVPVGVITESEQDTLLSLEEIMHRQIIGQDPAVRTVASAIRRMRSGMVRPHRPAGSFLFLGPTGVGKTEMAKVLAQQYFGDAKNIIRVDMSEYQNLNALDRLIGSKELGQQGMFVSQVREHPYALVLLDEIEKANERVLDIFLQVLDEGFLHDAFGRKVSFETMIIIATSNAGALTIKKMIEMDMNPADMEKKVIDSVMEDRVFRPEFINRFDDVVIFAPLANEDILHVTQLLLDKFAQRVAEDQDITLEFAADVAAQVVARGFDPVFGARSLHHYIDNVIADVLAKKMIKGNVRRGENVYFTIDDMNI